MTSRTPTERQRALIGDHLFSAVHGAPRHLRTHLAELATATGADEFLLTGSTRDQAHSDHLLAGLAER